MTTSIPMWLRAVLIAIAFAGRPTSVWSQQENPSMQDAALRGDLEQIKELLKEDKELANDAGKNRRSTPLHKAIEGGQLEAARLLLDNGADLEFDAFGDGRPLQVAIEKRKREIAELLLERGADPDGIGRTEDEAPIVKADGDPELIKLLLKHKANVDGIDRSNRTALIQAARDGNFRVAKLLIDAGATVDATCRYPRGTALDCAIRGGHLEVAHLLLQHGASPGKSLGLPPLTDDDLKDAEVVTKRLKLAVQVHRQFHGACANGQVMKLASYLEKFPYLAQTPDNNNRTYPLIHAVTSGNTEIITLLIEHGADPNKKDSSEGSPLVVAIRLGNLETITTLIDNGANVNLKGVGSDPMPLHSAVLAGDLKVVELLLNRNAAINATQWPGHTAFSLAVEHANLDAAKLLVKHGAHPQASEKGRYPPLTAAVRSGSGEMVRYILGLGVSESERRAAMQTAASMKREALVKLIADAGVGVDTYSLLKLGRLHELGELLQKDPELVNTPPMMRYGYEGTLLHLAAQERDIKAAKVLLDHGAKPDLPDRRGYSALHSAAMGGSLELVQLLIENGANLNAEDAKGMTPLDIIDPDANRDFRFFASLEEGAQYDLIREHLVSQGAKSGLFVPADQKRTGEIAKEKVDRGPALAVGRWNLYPGGRYELENATAKVVIRNAAGQRAVEVTFKSGDERTIITHDPTKEKPVKLLRTGGKMKETVEYKTMNDFRDAEPKLLERFRQAEKDMYAGDLEGDWTIIGPAVAGAGS